MINLLPLKTDLKWIMVFIYQHELKGCCFVSKFKSFYDQTPENNLIPCFKIPNCAVQFLPQVFAPRLGFSGAIIALVV